MRIDPSDDCTFWYTQEYQATTQSAGWNTRIGTFKFLSCGQALTSTTTALTSSLNPSSYGNSVTFTATVAPSSGPTGSVTFKDGSTVLSSQTLNASGQAAYQTSSLTVGTHSITAAYSGDGAYSSSTSTAVSQVVNQASTSTSISGPSSSTYGQQVTFNAGVTPAGATGSVQFFDGAASLGTSALSNGATSLSTSALQAGSHTITAKYLGNTNYLSSVSAPGLSLTVTQAATSTTLSSAPNPSGVGQSVTFTAAVTPGAATGTVTFTVDGNSQAPVALSGGQAKYTTSSLTAGNHNVSAHYNGDSNNLASTSNTVVQTVNGTINTTASLTSSNTSSTFGTLVTFTAAVSPAASTGTLQFLDGSTLLGQITLSAGTAKFSTSTLAVGRHSITAKYLGDATHNASTSNVVTQQVKRK
jgi:hypothetical protein